MAAREDRAKRRRERRAGSNGEARAHERSRSAEKAPLRVDGTRAPLPEQRSGGGPAGFVRESVAELRKVEWPGQSQVIQATTVVIVACIIVGTWLYLNDFVWQRVVKDFLLK
jgi:preprotein translocase SecE subunit